MQHYEKAIDGGLFINYGTPRVIIIFELHDSIICFLCVFIFRVCTVVGHD